MELSVLIVNYNARDHLKNCLESLYQNTTHRPLEVLVVDNASVDGSLEMLERDFEQVRVIASKENLGFGCANNLAMTQAQGRFQLLLNNDTLVPTGSIDTMLQIIQERPEVGILGPLTRNEDGSVQISYGRMLSFHAEAMQKFLFASHDAGNRLVRWYVDRRAQKEVYPDWVSGACLLLRSELLDKTGFFDENFFMYSEEVDFCQRVRATGYHVLYTPEAEMVHLRGKSSETNSEKTALEYRRSQMYFYLKHYGRGKLRLLKVYLLAKLALASIVGRASRRGFYHRAMKLVWNY